MKIIYVHTTHWVSNSPSVTFVTFNAAGIAQNEIETHLMVINNKTEETKTIFANTFAIDLPSHLTIHRINATSHWQFFRQTIKTIKKRVDEKTIVITRSISFLPHLLWLRRQHSFKILYESHDFFWNLSLRNDINKIKKWKHSFYEKTFIPQTDGLICLQNSQKNLYTQYLPQNFPIIVLRTGIHQIYPFPQHIKPNILAYIGSLDLHKGIDHIINFAQKLKSTYTIKIFGGKTKAEIENFQQKLSQNNINNVQIKGWLDKNTLHQELNGVKWGLVPLKDTFFNRYLTSPLKLFDFYGHGIPVIASDLPTLKELVIDDETGFIVDWQNYDDVWQKINIPTSHYQRLVNNIRQKSETLLWQNRGKNLIEFIQNL